MKFLIIFSLVITQFLTAPFFVQAKEKNVSMQQIKNEVNFKVLVPKRLPKDLQMNIKPYPPTEYGKPTKFTMTFTKNKQFVFNIQERKSNQKELDKDVYSYGQPVSINGNRGYFLTSGHKDGHLLIWIQNGTVIEMDSTLSKEKMLEIAQSVE
ncbi:DUF4367 domain-containing protein [Pullulanibacillus sp. KACC 23026]|uniref:DUF4367 domain-containing protein n=1 Tax=Pullulanibacillus sp. KACC 23026 TaxID=3028315 RepID=UPI0023AE89A8|nr:DUF4367 domain-containing protein [Pullulanibacillus sp. KACC 23026]WEG14579.1 DUF4367 domain-containing protein [Pullulanibacillus sp. KACC 23026]